MPAFHRSIVRRFVMVPSITLACLTPPTVLAVAPTSSVPDPIAAEVVRGKQLFEQDWTSNSDGQHADGLGPLFNASSCAACHHQGGAGGGGDSKFNSKSIGIDEIRGEAVSNTALLNRAIAAVHPAFIQSGSAVATVSLPHFGGSPMTQSFRDKMRQSSSGVTATEGGDESADSVRQSMAYSTSHRVVVANQAFEINTRIYQRNTSSLFGTGLIDQISNDQIEAAEKSQLQHPEISGRRAILPDGTVGRFGWRANQGKLIRFVDQACTNEMGLETERRNQTSDITNTSYKNPGIDISDDDVRSMFQFVAALPRPTRSYDVVTAEAANHGERLFHQVGCAICHIKSIGPAEDLYSDILLHDMGPYNYDYDTATPHVIFQMEVVEPTLTASAATPLEYYGVATLLVVSPGESGSASAFGSAMSSSPGLMRTPRASLLTRDSALIEAGDDFLERTLSIRSAISATRLTRQFRVDRKMERKLQPSMVSQEWRTPPLWGVADSAPYMHDGRAETLLEAVSMHGGESAGTRDRFLALSYTDRQSILGFMSTLVAPQGL